MASRTGIPTITKLARTLCILISKWQSVIRVVTDNDPLVIAALETALTACAVLDAELTRYREFGD